MWQRSLNITSGILFFSVGMHTAVFNLIGPIVSKLQCGCEIYSPLSRAPARERIDLELNSASPLDSLHRCFLRTEFGSIQMSQRLSIIEYII